MATTVYNSEEFVLSDGTPVTLRPLPVKYLRKVMAEFSKYTRGLADAVKEGNADSYDPDGSVLLDTLVNCCSIALEGYKVTVEDVEEVLDVETMYKIMEIGADIKLNNASANLAPQQTQVLAGAVGQN